MNISLPSELGRHAELVALEPKARALFAYWQSKCGARGMPARRDLSVTDLAPFLPDLVWVDPLENRSDFRFRLIGTTVVRRMIVDRTGTCFSETAAMRSGTKFWGRYDWVAHFGRPLFSEVEYVGDDTSVRVCQDLILPLADDVPGGISLMTLVLFLRFGQD